MIFRPKSARISNSDMSTKPAKLQPLDLSKWRNVPTILIGVGGVLAVLGLIVDHKTLDQFASSWLLAFMFCLSIGLGALFLVLAHHLFDAGWSVPIRRFCEHLASLLPIMFFFWIPIWLMRKSIFGWMSVSPPDEPLKAKHPLFTQPGFLIASLAIFAVWFVLTNG